MLKYKGAGIINERSPLDEEIYHSK